MLNTSPWAPLLAFVCRLWCCVCLTFFDPFLLVGFLLLHADSSLYVLDTNPWSGTCFANIFSRYLWVLFSFS